MSVFIASLQFPQGLGKSLLSTTTNRQQTLSLFSNFTWMSDDLTVEQAAVVAPWGETNQEIFITLAVYMVGLVSYYTLLYIARLNIIVMRVRSSSCPSWRRRYPCPMAAWCPFFAWAGRSVAWLARQCTCGFPRVSELVQSSRL